MTNKKHILSGNEAIQDLKILNELVLSIFKNGKIKNSEANKKYLDPYEAPCEKYRMSGILFLMDKYNYRWCFTLDRKENRLFTQDEQIQNIIEFQSYILSIIDKPIIDKPIIE